MILIPNATKFETFKDLRDKEGRFILLKGKIENQLVTLKNVNVPPDGDKVFFKKLLEIMVQETEGILICGGEFNISLNQNLDKTSTKKGSKIQLYTELAELEITDVRVNPNPNPEVRHNRFAKLNTTLQTHLST